MKLKFGLGLLNFIKMYNDQLNVIKRGSRIILLQYRQIAFVDAMSFGPNCSLDSFGKMWGAKVTKGCFPYEKYQTIAQLRQDKVWPELIDFQSKLSGKTYHYTMEQIEDIYTNLKHKVDVSKMEFRRMINIDESTITLESPIDLVVYCEMWSIFENGKRNGTICNMLDFLCHYNALDTELLVDAMRRYIKSFLDNFQTCPNEYLTLPGISERILWNYYDDSQYKPYSFNQEFANISDLIRSQLAGGLSCVFSRHVEVGSGDMIHDETVYKAQNGDRFTQLVAYDVNSE